MKKKILKLLKIIAGIFLGLIIVFVGLILFFQLIRIRDLYEQKQYLNNLATVYEDYNPVDESEFTSFTTADENLYLNEIQLLASHNSYKKRGTNIGKLFVGLGDSFEEARKLRYGNPKLTTQLNQGIRSFELDVRVRKDQFEAIHVPLVDNSSTAPNFALGLQEIALWSTNNPTHIPLFILLELKNDWMILDPALKDFTDESLLELDQLIATSFGSHLITPNDIKGNADSLKEAVNTNGWPLLTDTLGKVIVILHPGDYTDQYVQLDASLDSLHMFPAVSLSSADANYAAFVVHNNPNPVEIQPLINDNFIVRTRADADLIPDETGLSEALLSGAQLISSDFIPGHTIKGYDFICYLEDKKTIIKNTYLIP